MQESNSPIRVAINGYGNLGRAVEAAVHAAPDLELVAIFTRRDPQSLQTLFAPAVHVDQAADYVGKVDVCALCGGSATDLQTQGPQFAALFNTVDSFDNHALIPQYFETMNEVCTQNSTVSVISTGWDPGLFSLQRLIAQAVLPQGQTTTFWGRGVSQGHSDAIRRIDGVEGAIQYTVPVQSAKARALEGEAGDLSARQKHRRECFVVAAEGADRDRIREQIVTMPNYFEPYDTTVEFISAEELARDHAQMPHGGDVIRAGTTAQGAHQSIHFNLALGSNPQFTGAMVTATCRAVARLAAGGELRALAGAYTVFDIPPTLYCAQPPADLRRDLL
ncbi:MAG: diaminopimelate dehydrogenase [Actinomycetaceae bacterium]|nr:diaminopimelate dehydrogenase [Actinomycetaceae bacterium]